MIRIKGFTDSSWRSWCICLLSKDNTLIYRPSSCRSYIEDVLALARENTTVIPVFIPGMSDTYLLKGLEKGPYKIFLDVACEKRLTLLLKNLPYLNSLENKWGLSPTKVFHTQHKNCLVVKGDKRWKSSLWKSSLYTNYIKTLFMEDEYTGMRDDNEDMLWELVSRKSVDKYRSLGDVHNSSGFVSLLEGRNLNSHIISEFISDRYKKSYTPIEKKLHLSEIFQSLDIKFSFLDKNYRQVTVPAKCRDFLGDCIFSRIKETPVNIYGFSYDYSESPYYLDKTRLLLTFPSILVKNKFIRNLNTLHSLEEEAHLCLTKVYKVEGANLALIVEGDKNWQEDSWKISLYSFYLKKLSYSSDKCLLYPEKDYNKTLTTMNEGLLLKNIRRETSQYMCGDLMENHNYSGFVSILTGRSKPVKMEQLL